MYISVCGALRIQPSFLSTVDFAKRVHQTLNISLPIQDILLNWKTGMLQLMSHIHSYIELLFAGRACKW